MLLIGAHVDGEDPLGEAAARRADLVQFFLGDPQDWRDPPDRADAEVLRAAGVVRYVHAPYVMNIASTNNRIRIPSRKLLARHADVAASIGAAGLVVHAGHVARAAELATGIDNWRKTFERWQPPLPVLIENTAGGDHALARRLDALARLWDAIGGFQNVGLCLDTCHAHAGGEDLLGLVDRVKAVTGRVDLVHCNDSKDDFDSRRDRHENLGAGRIDPDLIVAVVQAAGAPVICETPGGASGQAADVAFLRERLGG